MTVSDGSPRRRALHPFGILDVSPHWPRNHPILKRATLSDYSTSPHPDQFIIGLPSHRALRFLDALPLPRACHDRLDHEYAALRVAALAISRPLDNETVIVASDIDGCGLGLVAIRHTVTSAESIDAVQRGLFHPKWFGHDTTPVAAITVLTVLRNGFSPPPVETVHRFRQQLDAAQITLDRWFCLDTELRSVDVETLVVVPH